MCLPNHLEGKHKCVEKVSRSNCPVCQEDIHTSRIPSQIPPCNHLIHKNCFDEMLSNGHYACPTCGASMIPMSDIWKMYDKVCFIMFLSKLLANQDVQCARSHAKIHIILSNQITSCRQCLGSGSVGSARFWLPGSGSAKICGSTDPGGKISTKSCKKNFLSKPKSELLSKG